MTPKQMAKAALGWSIIYWQPRDQVDYYERQDWALDVFVAVMVLTMGPMLVFLIGWALFLAVTTRPWATGGVGVAGFLLIRLALFIVGPRPPKGT